MIIKSLAYLPYIGESIPDRFHQIRSYSFAEQSAPKLLHPQWKQRRLWYFYIQFILNRSIYFSIFPLRWYTTLKKILRKYFTISLYLIIQQSK